MKKTVKHTNKFLRYLPSIVFAVLVFGPFALNFFVSNTEMLDNRPLNPRPTQIDRNFPLLFDNYYNDTFAWRGRFIRLYNRIRKNTGLAQSEIVINGSDGWLFFDSFKQKGVDDSIGDFLGAMHYSLEEKQRAAENLQALSSYAQKHNSFYLTFFAPNKENAYEEYMPAKYRDARVSAVSRADDLFNYINANTSAKIINMKPLFLNKKNNVSVPLYQKTDTHWNETGAYLAFEEIIKELNKKGFGIKITSFDNMKFTPQETRPGDLGRMIDSTAKEYKYNYSMAASYTCDSEEEDVDVLKCASSSGKGKKVLVIRDSFGLALIAPMSTVFKETVFLRHPSQETIKEYINDFKPDAVLELKTERNAAGLIGRTFTLD
ncbi:hypothetical protein Dip510_001463 [Elusimicrobium posterum]|uniref:alginate O-acetyltransferase AlgX-related protein n=1 Tax=Elusimicrobium posterum TaxID=3116653 RepID=UPI003C794B85